MLKGKRRQDLSAVLVPIFCLKLVADIINCRLAKYKA